jgi:hypothetical protein
MRPPVSTKVRYIKGSKRATEKLMEHAVAECREERGLIIFDRITYGAMVGKLKAETTKQKIHPNALRVSMEKKSGKELLLSDANDMGSFRRLYIDCTNMSVCRTLEALITEAEHVTVVVR